jgi:hypothetical protein
MRRLDKDEDSWGKPRRKEQLWNIRTA